MFDRSYDVDQQASVDFAHFAVGDVAVAAKQIVEQYYGQPADYSYFAGCSTGGREAMLMTQRYPSTSTASSRVIPQFTRVIPVWRTLGSRSLQRGRAEGRERPPAAASVVLGERQKLVVDGVLAACDADDGIADKMVFNMKACDFDPSALVCSGEKTDSCLAAHQVGALKKGFAGPRNSKAGSSTA